MALRRMAVALVTLLVLASPCTAAAPALDFSASPTFALRGMTSRISPGQQGGVAFGTVTFDAAGAVTGGNITSDAAVGAASFTGGELNVDGQALEGFFDTGNTSTTLHVHGIAASNDVFFVTTETVLPTPNFPGLLVGVRQGGTFSTADLAGSTWRFKSLGVPFPHSSGQPGWAFGSVNLSANASVTGGFISFADGGGAFDDGTVTINGSGDVQASASTDTGAFLSLDGAMSPDKKLIAACITFLVNDQILRGMVILQREPTTTFSTNDLAGTYDVVGLDQHANTSNVGQWLRGNVTFTSAGNVSAGTVFDSAGATMAPGGSIALDSSGFVCGGSCSSPAFSLGADAVELEAIMTEDKKTIVGVTSRMTEDILRVGLFAWVKRATAAVSTLAFSKATYSKLEGNTSATIRVLRAGDTSATVTVEYATANAATNPATAHADYTPAAGTLTFAPGVTQRTFTVAILDDALLESTERVALVLSNPTGGATLADPSTAELRIQDNDARVQFSAAAYARNERAGATSLRVDRTGYLKSTVTVQYMIANGTATAGLDYNAASTGTLTFGANVVSVPLPVTILQDTLVESDETVVFSLVNPTGGAQLGARDTATLTIRDDDVADTLGFGSPTFTATEGGPAAVIRVVRSGGAAGGVTVDYETRDGTATAGTDYTPRSGTLSFNAGQMVKTFRVPIIDNASVDGTRTVILILRNPTGGASLPTPHRARLRILDDDSTVQFGAAAFTRRESVGATSIPVVRTGSLTDTATVQYMIGNSTATAGSDYNAAASGMLTFAPGDSRATIPLTIRNDRLVEGPEVINLLLLNPTGNMRLGARSQTAVTIVDDDVAGTVSFLADVFTAVEGGPAAVITVVRSGGTAGGVTVQYTTANGTATAGEDYRRRTGTISFGAGQTTKTFTVPILDDSLGEPTETVRLTLSNPTGGASLGLHNAVLRIEDNEPVVQFTGNWVGSAFEVRRTGNTNVTVTVDYAAEDGTATAGLDYRPLAGTLTFGPGVTTRLIPIHIIADDIKEGDETFTLFLLNPVNARLGGFRSRLMVIKDND